MGIGTAIGLIGALRTKTKKEITEVTNDIQLLTPAATPSDVGKALIVKTVSNGKATSYEYGAAADPQDIQDDVNNWLDDHPEATTTVQDGAISLPKLNEALKNNVIIEQESEQAYYHDVAPKIVSFYPDERIATVSCKYVKSANLIENKYETGTQNGVTKTKDGRFLKLKGTQDSGQLRFLNISDSATMNKLKGKTVNVYVYIKKSTNWESGSTLQMNDGLNNIVYDTFSTGSSKLIGWTKFENISIRANASQIYFRIQSTTGNVFADGDFMWVGIYETTATDTEHVIEGEDPYTISMSDASYVDTMMHQSKVVFITPTKQYVDDHTPDIIGYWNDNVYAMPEKFGAVGNGVADDTQAIADCIAYAITKGKAVKGFGKYKTTAAIVLNAQYLDVYLKEINYTGNGNAVEIKHMDIRFEFHRIESSNVGISFDNNGGSPAKYARRCVVKGNEITSTNDCIVCHGMTLYNTVDIRFLSSAEANCILSSRDSLDFAAGEYVFRSSSCACPNGFAIYNMQSCKFYDFTIEGNCKYGLRNPNNCICVGFRHREQTDKIGSRLFGEGQNNNGPLIVFTGSASSDGLLGFKFIASDSLPWYAIDVSAIKGYDPIPSGASSTDDWHKLGYNGITLGTPIRGAYNTARINIAADMCFIGNNKVFIPSGRKIATITDSTCDLTSLEGNTDTEIRSANAVIYKMATDFLLNVAHADIYLNASYGAIGYNDITLTQENGNTATIYDKLGNVLFDGTSEGDGKWRFRCYVDPSSCGRLSYTTAWWCYDGTNEIWEIEKLQ